MSTQPFVGEIKLFAGNFSIMGHAYCQGQLMPISQNEALFSLIGTTYGGDGVTTFGLPDLRGRVPLHQGNGAGLSPRTIGENGGTETVTLTANQLPSHTHAMNCNAGTGNSSTPANNFWAAQPALLQYAAASTASSALKSNAVSNSGNSQPHPNLQPYLTINYLIALEGIFPSRN
ncbi:MAG: phage tail protein [Chitinophagaceae bacterium]